MDCKTIKGSIDKNYLKPSYPNNDYSYLVGLVKNDL